MDTIQLDKITDETPLLTGFAEKRVHTWGSAFEGPIPIEAATRMIGWEPERASVQGTILTESGVETIHDPSRQMLVHPRTRLPIAVHGSGYTVHPYADTLLNQAAQIVDNEVGLARVGSLRGGKQAFVQYEMNDTVTAGGRGAQPIEFRPFLNAATSLDGSLATTFFTGTTVIVCENTLAAALGDARRSGHQVKVRHTINSRLNVGLARQTLNVLFSVADDFQREIDALTSEFVSDQKWRDFLEAAAPTEKKEGRALTMAENKQRELTNLWNNDQRVAPWRNSAYGVLAAVNTYSHHIATVKGADRNERNATRIIDGSLAKLDATTLRILASV